MATTETNRSEVFSEKIEAILQSVATVLFRFLFTVGRMMVCLLSVNVDLARLLKDKRVLRPTSFVVISLLIAVFLAKTLAMSSLRKTSGETFQELVAALESTSEVALLFWLIPVFAMLIVLTRCTGWVVRNFLQIDSKTFERAAGYSMGVQFNLCAIGFVGYSWGTDFVPTLMNRVFSGKLDIFLVLSIAALGALPVLLPTRWLAHLLKQNRKDQGQPREWAISLTAFLFHSLTLVLIAVTWHFQLQTSLASTEIRYDSISFLCTDLTARPNDKTNSVHLAVVVTSNLPETLIVPKNSLRVRVAWRREYELRIFGDAAKGLIPRAETNSTVLTLTPHHVESGDNASPVLVLKKDEPLWCSLDFHLGKDTAEFSTADLREMTFAVECNAISKRRTQIVSRYLPTWNALNRANDRMVQE